MTDDALALWQCASVSCMSDEETDEESGNKVFRTLPWRNEVFNDLIARIDEALGVKRIYSDRKSERSHKGVNEALLSPELL